MKTFLKLSAIFLTISLSNCDFNIPDEFKYAKSAIYAAHNREAFKNSAFNEQIDIEGRIVGGEIASLGQLPYHTLIYMREDETNITYICGGALIRRNYVLTAASCLNRYVEFNVFVGVVDRVNGPYAWYSEPITNLSNIIIHPQYIQSLSINNIGLIHLSNAPDDLLSYPNVGMLEIPYSTDVANDFESIIATASGFGIYNDTHDELSDVLRYVSMPVISNSWCALFYPDNIVSSHICTNTLLGRSPCPGDLGTPLTVDFDSGRRAIIGIGNFGSAPCTSSGPAVFQRITSHWNWLVDIVGRPNEPETTTPASTTPNSSSMIKINVSILFACVLFVLKN